jgi:lipopolysaccharide transport system ATP-binding protein
VFSLRLATENPSLKSEIRKLKTENRKPKTENRREFPMAPIIRVEQIGKCYRLNTSRPRAGQNYHGYRSLREEMMNALRWPVRRFLGDGASQEEEFWALRDVSFSLEPGETLAIVGRNGAGKSTLLKILSRITKPSTGEVELRGRVGSLLEVGTGFHPELTGEENIYLNGAILGMSRAEIKRRFDEIVAFAEIEKFLDTPVKHYSTGMYLRLAFAVAAHLEPEILVADEVLAVGDAEFQRKCLKKMGDVAGQGRTVLFVSHNMNAVQTLCKRAVLLERGQVKRIGKSRDVVMEYLQATEAAASTPLKERHDRIGEGRFRFEEIKLLDANGHPRPYGVTGEDLYLSVRMHVPNDGPLAAPLEVVVVVREPQGMRITALGCHYTGESPKTGAEAREMICHIPRLPLLPAQYRLDLWCGIMGEEEDYLLDGAVLRVEPGNYFQHVQEARSPMTGRDGYCVIPQQWGAAAGVGRHLSVQKLATNEHGSTQMKNGEAASPDRM